MTAESKRSDQVKKPSASSAVLRARRPVLPQRLNLVLADMTEQETSAAA